MVVMRVIVLIGVCYAIYLANLIAARSSAYQRNKASKNFYIYVKQKYLYKYLICNGQFETRKYVPQKGDENKILIVGLILHAIAIFIYLSIFAMFIDFETTITCFQEIFKYPDSILNNITENYHDPHDPSTRLAINMRLAVNYLIPIYIFMTAISILDDILGFIISLVDKIKKSL